MSGFERVRQLQAELDMVSKLLGEATNRARSQKDQLGALTSAGEWTCYALSELLHAGLFWLGLQRVLLKDGLQLKDLDELDRLDLSVATRVLAELGLASGETKRWVETNYAEGLRNEVEHRLRQLSEAAAESYKTGGLPKVDLEELWIIEYSYGSVDRLRLEICHLFRLTTQRALTEKEQMDLFLRIGGAIAVLGWAIDVAVNFEQVRAAASNAAQNMSQWAQAADLRVWATLAILGVAMMAWQSARTLGHITEPDDGLGPAGSEGPRPGGPRGGPRRSPARSPSRAPSGRFTTTSEPSSPITRAPSPPPPGTATPRIGRTGRPGAPGPPSGP